MTATQLRLRADPQAAGCRLDHFLQQQLPEYSRSRLKSWIQDGRVRVNGQPAKPATTLRGTEFVDVEPAAPPPLRAFPENLPLAILYEDADVIVVNKPPGLVVHIGAGTHSGTLVNALLHHFGRLSTEGGEIRPGIVHRLDRFTSGVMVVARSNAAHRALSAQFAGREIEKLYLALVHRRLTHDTGRINRPISRDPLRRTRMTARLASGRTALTQYRVLERFGNFTLLEVRIGTGRTHQIRVHLASIGHPIAGDRLYGAPAEVPELANLDRYLLHSHRLIFRSPSSGHLITVEAPLPADFAAWLDALRAMQRTGNPDL